MALVCGYVNAKKSFGGYTGSVPFIGELHPDGDENEVWFQGQADDIHVQTTKMMCAKYGITL
ncbi:MULTISPECIES: hypothetical protein [unclassified Mesorhizobium]|uniref:hypothetical protein n=1 Tax=unclassified Mesorhizobium TaxID=325217 RepID=UPI00112B0B9F|nr:MULTISPECIES: hypothetical protein [unclassified Mesorhizobium]TPJ44611.1 hypothetical protein FJ437_19300 [Mesorhizobium sp. B2-6-6]MCA0000919.1 hypothetical protein [Mesorhizobium sp. B264B2A]MCA0004668.1 hypothetical protein [Mesorhizobium sp. B264B1B]MCA0019133.1 hypothetical protein [Mesorhizobium sp. B264B1A]TPJ51287.1 hypothetical protein FJ462_33490 [Mesorhizobium sp. B2-6-7]